MSPLPQMMKAKKMADDPLMKSSEAPLMDHLVELRSRLLKSLIALAVAFAFCFYFADFIFVFQRYLNINPRGQFNMFHRSGQRLN